jgi:hypothetical protein
MSFSTRIQTSWELLQRSLQVLRDQPRLLFFPAISTVCSIVLGVFFAVPIVLLFIIGHQRSRGDFMVDLNQPFFYGYGAMIYLVGMITATFVNVASYHQIIRALSGEQVSLGGGLRFARSRWKSILMWSLLAGTVGLIIRAIEDRLGWLGRIGLALLGTVWSVASVFAIPVIIRQGDTNPLDVLKNSAATLKKTWGESLAGFVGIRLAGTLVVLLALGSGLVVFAVAVMARQMSIAIGLGVVWILSVIAIGVLVGMATHVYRCALYVYASEGIVPAPYTTELMDAGWKIKRG